MRTHVAAVAVVVATLAAAGPLAAQAIQGPTYRTFFPQVSAPITLTSWTASAGIGGIDTPLYYHWFTGTITLPAWGFSPTSPADEFHQQASETVFYTPFYPSANDPTSPYTGCAECRLSFTVSTSDPRGAVIVINTAATMGRIATTYGGFLVPISQNGIYNYQEFHLGMLTDRDTFDDRATFVMTAAAPTATPEPATWALLGGGLLVLGIVGRRRDHASDQASAP